MAEDLNFRTIELLAPAKDLTCGIEAVNHGADAVYIGAPKFGARSVAGNTLEDIRRLCAYAHRFRVKIYVALNTILKDEELAEAETMICRLYESGVDALIIQDMGITRLNLPPIPLHASTQTDNRTAEHVRFLQDSGFTQVVLARELSLNEIRTIASRTSVHLEVFVHGALCVCYSGQCYLSAALSGRSANRGECAQYCRLPYTMVDADDKVIVADRHLLSLKDMNRSSNLEALLDAGVSSFKIEGRLKDVSYVKNITAYYRKKLDEIFEKRTEYRRSSSGKVSFSFEPVAEKSFNRGFTDYLLKGRTSDITAFDSPKSLGEKVGTVKEIRRKSFTVAGTLPLHNGDGLVFFNDRGNLEGFRVNKVEDNRIYPLEMFPFKPKTVLFRNYDHEFEKTLSRSSAERKIRVDVELIDNAFGMTLLLKDEDGNKAMITRAMEKEEARKDQRENIRIQLAKLGNTDFEAMSVKNNLSRNWFIPSSVLSDMRREGVEALESVRRIAYRRESAGKPGISENAFLPERLTYLGNVSNAKARQFYFEKGVKNIDPAFELEPRPDIPLMFTKHCLRYSLGWCPVYQKKKSLYKEPFYLIYKDTRLRLQFDCKECRMLLFRQ